MSVAIEPVTAIVTKSPPFVSKPSLAYPRVSTPSLRPRPAKAVCASLPRELTQVAGTEYVGRYPLVVPSTTVGEPQWAVRTRRTMPSAATDPCPTPETPETPGRRLTGHRRPVSRRPAAFAIPAAPPRATRSDGHKRRLIIGVLLAIALVAAMTVAIVYGVRTNGANTGAAFSEGIGQNGDSGLSGRAREPRHRRASSRNALCGLYDGVRDKRSDQALAKLSSDAFRKQFSQVAVDLDRQDRVLVAVPGPGAVHDAGVACHRRPDARTGPRRRAAAFPARRHLGVLVRAAYRWLVLAPGTSRRSARQLNESPHAHEPVAFGLSMVKPCFSMVSTKSMDAPSM